MEGIRKLDFSRKILQNLLCFYQCLLWQSWLQYPAVKHVEKSFKSWHLFEHTEHQGERKFDRLATVSSLLLHSTFEAIWIWLVEKNTSLNIELFFSEYPEAKPRAYIIIGRSQFNQIRPFLFTTTPPPPTFITGHIIHSAAWGTYLVPKYPFVIMKDL